MKQQNFYSSSPQDSTNILFKYVTKKYFFFYNIHTIMSHLVKYTLAHTYHMLVEHLKKCFQKLA
jgi:hypothetical protein